MSKPGNLFIGLSLIFILSQIVWVFNNVQTAEALKIVIKDRSSGVISFPDATQKLVKVNCQKGEVATGGGYTVHEDNILVTDNRPGTTLGPSGQEFISWVVEGWNPKNGNVGKIEAHVVCAKVVP